MTKVVICTSPRPENYIYRAISSMREQIALHFFVSGNNASYLDRYKGNPNVTITTVPTNSEKILFKQFTNYTCCLNGGYIEGEKGIFVIEDDIKFAKGWKLRLDGIISELELKYGDKFAISLFTALPICKDNELPSSYYLPLVEVDKFIGTQGMYYPDFVRRGILKHFERYNELNVKNYDAIVKDYLVENRIPLFITIPCLVNHTGFKSSWYHSQFTNVAIVFHDVLN